jgi:hypothetical protein
VDAPALDWLVRLVLDAVAREGSVDLPALRFLLRRYAVTGDDALGEAAGVALARAIEPGDRDRRDDLPTRLVLIVEAASLSDDERLRTAATALADELRQRWPHEATASAALPAVEACLLSVPLVDLPGLAAAAIDELERVVGAAYRPGEGIGHGRVGAASRSLDDHAIAANALLTAWDVTGRLPYAMLADDLMQFARRCWWDGEQGGFRDSLHQEGGLPWFAANCEAARALCRLAHLYAEPEYRQAAVVADDCDHAADARRTLARLAPVAMRHGLAGAVFGLALDEAGTLL